MNATIDFGKIKCEICEREFNKLLSPTHLKTHGISAKEYCEKYNIDSVYTIEYREHLANKMKEKPLKAVLSEEGKKRKSEKIAAANRKRKLTDETKAKISAGHAKRNSDPNYVHPNKGFKHTEETRQKVSTIKKKQAQAADYVNPMQGNNHTEESKATMSENRSGLPAWNEGIPTPEHVTRKQSEIMLAKYASGELAPWNVGVPMPEKSKALVSEGVKLYAINNPEIMTDRGKKAFQTKLERFGQEYVDQHQLAMIDAITEEGRQKQIDTIKEQSKLRSERATERFNAFMEEKEFTVFSNDGRYVDFVCGCGVRHKTRRQAFNYSNFKNDYCQFCVSPQRSRMEIEVEEFVRDELGIMVRSSDRTIITPYEIDILCTEHNIGIEFCGVYWHSELLGKDKHYHRNKLDMCSAQNIDLIQIYEHEWLYKQDVVKSILSTKFNKNTVIDSEGTNVKEISLVKANKFLNENHLQGSADANIAFGLFHNNELYGVMSFTKDNISRKYVGWEINRMAFKKFHSIVGGANKLFKEFIKAVDPEEVVSLADLRYGQGKVYGNLRFEFNKRTVPNYWYFRVKSKPDYLDVRHRFALRKNYMEGVDDNDKTEWENRVEQGWNRIWDCGHNKWIWTKANS